MCLDIEHRKILVSKRGEISVEEQENILSGITDVESILIGQELLSFINPITKGESLFNVNLEKKNSKAKFSLRNYQQIILLLYMLLILFF